MAAKITKLYIRKIFRHDTDHEISVATEIVRDYFNDKTSFNVIGVNSHVSGAVTINNATDPRLGGAMKSIITSEGGVEIDDIIMFTRNQPSEDYYFEVIKPSDSRYAFLINQFTGLTRHALLTTTSEDEESSDDSFKKLNKIYYGTPGCGKSFKVKELYCKKLKDGTNNYVRTIFHPEYSNVDFVGQLLPVKKGSDITYEFKCGPFTEALILAYKHKDEDVFLIIEELNRGNAAAIFGEIFQLLDRKENGESEYSIRNRYISEALLKETSINIEDIIIPSNLSIIATMNTSDQNVYQLDTAFQRRWEMEKVNNCFFKNENDVKYTASYLDDQKNYVSDRAYELAKMFIPGSNVRWQAFVEEINEAVIDPEINSFASDDKQLGIYFVSKNDLSDVKDNNNIELKRKFSEKILKYIWEDIAKINPENFFVESINSLDKVLNGFDSDALDIFNESFKFEERNAKYNPVSAVDESEVSTEEVIIDGSEEN